MNGIKTLSNNWEVLLPIPITMESWVKSGEYLIVSGVLDKVTSKMVNHEPEDQKGSKARYVRHWVAIRMINGDSITIINPYRNRQEQYSWSGIFKFSMGLNGNSLIRVVPQ